MNVSGSQKLEIIISAYTTLGFYVIPMFLQDSNTSLLFFVYWKSVANILHKQNIYLKTIKIHRGDQVENFYFPNLHTKYIHDIYFNNDIDLLIILSLPFHMCRAFSVFLKIFGFSILCHQIII